MTDHEALTKLRRDGSEAAFEEVFQRHWPMTRDVCHRILNDAEAAKDAAQATFIILHRKAASLGSGVCLAGWLYKTAVFVSSRHRRDRCREVKQVEAMKVLSSIESEIEADGSVWDEVKPHIDAAVDSLPATLRDAFVLRFFEGKELKETAAEIGCAENTASQRISRALKKIRLVLAKRGVAVSVVALSAALTEVRISAVDSTCFAELITSINHAGASSAALAIATKGIQIMFWKKCATIAAGSAIVFVLGIGTVRSFTNPTPSGDSDSINGSGIRESGKMRVDSKFGESIPVYDENNPLNKKGVLSKGQKAVGMKRNPKKSRKKLLLSPNIEKNKQNYLRNMHKFLVEKDEEKRFKILHNIMPVPRSVYNIRLAKQRKLYGNLNYPGTINDVQSFWLELLGDWDKHSLKDRLIWHARNDPSSEYKVQIVESMLRRWGVNDPSAMREFLLEHDFESLDPLSRDAFNRWRELLDMDRDDVDRILSQTSSGKRPETIKRLVWQWVAQDFDSAIAWIESVRDDGQRAIAVKAILSTIVSRDLDLAKSYIPELPEKDQPSAWAKLAIGVCETDPVEGIKLLIHHHNYHNNEGIAPYAYYPEVQTAIQAWVDNDFKGATRFLASTDAEHKNGSASSYLLERIAAKFAVTDPVAGEAFGKSLNGDSRNKYNHCLAISMAAHAPKKALAMIERNIHSESLPAIKVRIFMQWALHSPEDALEWASANSGEEDCVDEDILSGVISAWAQKSPLAAMDYLKKERLVQDFDPKKVSQLAYRVYIFDHKKATEWIRNEASPEAKKIFLNHVVEETRVEPARSIRCILDISDEEQRIPALKKFAATMGQFSGSKTFEKIAETGLLDDDALAHCNSAALINYSEHHGYRKGLEKASDLMLRTKNCDLREETIRKIYANWRKKNPKEAEAWLERTGAVSKDEKKILRLEEL